MHLSTGDKELLIASLLNQKKYLKKDFKIFILLVGEQKKIISAAKLVLSLKNFSGHSKLAIEQEFFALVFTLNMSSLLIEEA